MNTLINELVVDGSTAVQSGSLRRVSVAADSSSLGSLMDYKVRFPDSYRNILELLFRPGYGAGITHITAEGQSGKVFFADAEAVCPGITYGNLKEDTAQKNKFTEITERIINNIDGAYTLEQLISIVQPWSGFYKTKPGFWQAAHITHFIGKDWKYVKSSGGKGHGAYVSEDGDYTLLFINDSDSSIQYNVYVRNIEKSDCDMYCVETVQSPCSEENRTEWFRVIDKIMPAHNKTGIFYSIDVKPHSALTCTTLSVESVDGVNTVKPTGYSSRHLELPYSDSFNYSDEFLKTRCRIPLYSNVLSGEFEIRKFENVNVLEQAYLENNGTDKNAVIEIGDPCWSNYCVKAEIKFGSDNADNYAGIGLRWSRDCGYQLRIFPDRKWQLVYNDDIIVFGKDEIIEPDQWNTLKVYAKHNTIICMANKQLLCEHLSPEPMLSAGRAALCSALYSNRFRDFSAGHVIGEPCFCIFTEPFSKKIRYSDGWISDRKYAEDKGYCAYKNIRNTVSFEADFYGNTFSLMGKAKNLRLKIEVDGKIITAGFFIEKCRCGQVFYYRSGLSEQNHSIKVTVLSGELWFEGIAADDYSCIDKKHIIQKKENNNRSKSIKKSTLLIGMGLAAAGVGTFIFGKLFKKGKK